MFLCKSLRIEFLTRELLRTSPLLGDLSRKIAAVALRAIESEPRV
jgi:hypothetical protein